MTQNAAPSQMNQFVREVDLFMRNYASLINPQTKADVYATGDAVLIKDYNTAVNNGAALKASIENVTGAWAAAKSYYESLTDKSSMIIGDWIDNVRSWFGYDPSGGMSGLGALQIPAAAFVVGAIGAAVLLNRAMDKIFISIEASKLQRENPDLPRNVALDRAKNAVSTNLFGGLTLPLAAVALAALWFASR
jgi:hypothetical protein